MTNLDARLEQALKTDIPAMSDPMFRIRILERRERVASRRQLMRGVATALCLAVIAALSLTALGNFEEAGLASLLIVLAAGMVVTAVLTAPHLQVVPALMRTAGRWRERLPFGPRGY